MTSFANLIPRSASRISSAMKPLLTTIGAILCFLPVNAAGLEDAAAKIRYTSYNGLVMAGYQGWFNTPEDGAGLGWKHYKKGDRFEPGHCNIDLWPDISEYEQSYATPFRFADGTQARLFSSHDASTIELHFRWMREYGIDGVFMQRFIQTLKGEKSVANSDHILNCAVESAERNGRAICVMYDLSGMSPGDEQILIRDWKKLSRKYKIASRENNHYLYHNGKPLVAVWGIGFRNGNRRYDMGNVNRIIDFLIKEGCSILVGVPTSWRTLDGDAVADKRLHETILRADIVHPWFVGRFDRNRYPQFRQRIAKDIEWCRMHNKDYAPVVFPGFSWHNMKRGEVPQNGIPRESGRFFWDQVAGAVGLGARCLYLAMFDEMDEGTALFKCTTDPPVGASPFLNNEGVAPDHYLWLSGQAGRMLRGEIPFTQEMPKRQNSK